MKQYTVTIPDNKVNSFIDMMKNTPYVKNIEDSTILDIPEEHKKIVRERIKKYENKPESYMSWDDIEKNMKLD